MDGFPKSGQAVIGVRAYYHLDGAKERLLFYVLDDCLSKDSNSTIEAIHLTILAIHAEFEQNGDHPFPTVLHCEFDNASDNKSKWILGYFADLVYRGIFLNTSQCYLYRGHTHSIIDQIFSVIAELLRQSRYVTQAAFDALLRSILTQYNTSVVRISHFHDLKTYYTKYMYENIVGIQKPHEIRHWRTRGLPRSQYRQWSNTGWYPCLYAPSTESTIPNTVGMTDFIAEINRHAEAEGLESPIDGVQEDINGDSRIPNETSMDYLEWFHTCPDINDRPQIVPLHGAKALETTLKALESYETDPNPQLFTGAELAELKTFITNRLASIPLSSSLPSDWVWPTVKRVEKDYTLADPYAPPGDQWKAVHDEALKSLPPVYQAQLTGVEFELGMQKYKGMRASRKKQAVSASSSSSSSMSNSSISATSASKGRDSKMDEDDGEIDDEENEEDGDGDDDYRPPKTKHAEAMASEQPSKRPRRTTANQKPNYT